MRILIATVQLPFISGGAEVHAEILGEELRKKGHEADILKFPIIDYTADGLISAMTACRGIDLSEAKFPSADLVIAMKFPAYYVKHPNKVIWLMHQHRRVYDLWDTEYSDRVLYPEAEQVRALIFEHDNRYIKEARAVFSNSRTVSARLKKYNGINSVPLYSLPKNHLSFRGGPFGGYVYCPSRITKIKRQNILVDAVKYLDPGVKVKISGTGSREEVEALKARIKDGGLEDRVEYLGFVSEQEKLDLYSNCLAVYFGPYDEDLGYVTMEAFLSKKPVITHVDSGGPLEFVDHKVSGFVTPVSPKDVAQAVNELYRDRELAGRMGKNGFACLASKDAGWDHVIRSLVGER